MVGECTYCITGVLHKGVAAGLAAQCPGLVKEIVEPDEFAKLGKDLDEGVPRAKRNRLCVALIRVHPERKSTHSSTVG